VKKDAFTCSKQDCTYALTGTCLESIIEPTSNCPNLTVKGTAPPIAPTDLRDEAEAHEEYVRQFPPGLELGLQDIARIMRSRYARLIGVLGQVEAGKTCLFTSMYLRLTGRHMCPHFRFVTSETLLGFEQRARHLRDWSSGGVPEQIVDHTQLGHSRSPAFLHLAISDQVGRRHDFLLPDLPGEWTTRLLSDAGTSERFSFLYRSDAVLIVVEGPRFSNPRTRNNAITDVTHLLDRLANDIRLAKFTPVILAVTKCDKTDGKIPAELDRVVAVAADHGYSVTPVALAAFPTAPSTIPTGYGIDKLLSLLTASPASEGAACDAFVEGAERSYLKARG